MRNEAAIEINCPIEEVFRMATTCTVEWSKIVVEDEVIEEKPGMIGTTFRFVTAPEGSSEMEFAGVVTQHEVPHLHASIMRGRSFDMEVIFLFQEIGTKTRVTQSSLLTPKGFMKIVFFLLGWAMNRSSCKALELELQGLKACCEEDQMSGQS